MKELSKSNLHKDYLVRGLSSRELVPIYGYSFMTILNKLKEFEIPRRTYKENKMPTRKGGHLSKKHKDNISKALKGNPKVAGVKGEANPYYKSHKVLCFVCNKELTRKRCNFERFERFYCSPKCRSKHQSSLVGEVSPHWRGGDVTVRCAQCGKSLKRRKSIVSKSKTGRFFCDQKCAGIWKADNLSGSLVYNWKGGYDNYYGPNWPKQKRAALERDNKSCKICDKTQKQLRKNPDVHHIIPFGEFTIVRYKEANELDNLICFCSSCHSKVHNGTIILRGKTYKDICKEINCGIHSSSPKKQRLR